MRRTNLLAAWVASAALCVSCSPTDSFDSTPPAQMPPTQSKAIAIRVLSSLPQYVSGGDARVAKMNAKAALLGAYGTNAGSPSGIDAPGMAMWSTPHDLAVIFRGAMSYPVFAEITAQPNAVFPTRTGNRVLLNQDEMLHRYPGFLGGKTGYTDLARKTFVGAADRNGRRLVVAMMYGLVRDGGPSYWDQAAALLDWGFALDRGAGVGNL